jgi:hypothetical protein
MANDRPIGLLCQEGKANFSIINTFSQPLKYDVDGEQCRPVLLQKISSAKYNDPESYKKKIKQILSETQNNQLLDDYAKRVARALEISQNKKLVICGFIAQSVFEWVFNVNIELIKFTKPFDLQVGTYCSTVFYIWHPSPKSGTSGVSSWELAGNSSAISRLKKFISHI